MGLFRTAFLLVLSAFALQAANAQLAIGQWREHFGYRTLNLVLEAAGKVYAASDIGVLEYDPVTHEMRSLTKVNGLNDVNITALAWSEEHGALLVGYRNGNLDVVRGASTTNISDIRRSNVVGDKTINAIRMDAGRAYLACGFGIVQVDLDRAEIRDTYIIGNNATPINVWDICFFGDSIRAATEVGLFSVARSEPNPAAFFNWHRRNDLAVPGGAYRVVVEFMGKLVVAHDAASGAADSVYMLGGSGWEVFEPAVGQQVTAISTMGDRITLTLSGYARQFDAGGNETAAAYDLNGAWIGVRWAVARSGGGLWVAASYLGLLEVVPGQTPVAYLPNAPKTNGAYRMAASGGALHVTTGGHSDNWGGRFLKNGVHHFSDGRWTTTDMSNSPALATGQNTFGGAVNDFMGVAIDPADPQHVFVGTWDDGVVELRQGQVVNTWNTTNSSLMLSQSYSAAEGVVQVCGVAFDEEGNLWVANANCASPISVRMASGSWRAFTPGNIMGGNTLVSDIAVGRNGFKWLVRPRGNGLLVFDDGGTISNTADDRYRVLGASEGSGNLPAAEVLSVAVDRDDEVWIGTTRGVAVYFAPEMVFSNTSGDAQRILIEQDGNYQYLLETEAVSVIEVDGADRKWFGTQTSGVYLFSADGGEQVHHFTTANSPLPSNTITDIAVDGVSGEVFFGTDMGIVSFRGDATEGQYAGDCATVYPNPVHATHTGPVAITGLVRDSDVRITDVAGNLVYRTRSNGGQAIWPGTDLSGQRVSTGVYVVLVNDPYGESSCNTKVLVVR